MAKEVFLEENRSGETKGKREGMGTDPPLPYSALAETVFHIDPDP